MVDRSGLGAAVDAPRMIFKKSLTITLFESCLSHMEHNTSSRGFANVIWSHSVVQNRPGRQPGYGLGTGLRSAPIIKKRRPSPAKAVAEHVHCLILSLIGMN